MNQKLAMAQIKYKKSVLWYGKGIVEIEDYHPTEPDVFLVRMPNGRNDTMRVIYVMSAEDIMPSVIAE